MKVVSLPIVHHIEDTFAYIHDTTGNWSKLNSYVAAAPQLFCLDLDEIFCIFNLGLPWWSTVMIGTGLFRLLLTLPAHVTQQKVTILI